MWALRWMLKAFHCLLGFSKLLINFRPRVKVRGLTSVVSNHHPTLFWRERREDGERLNARSMYWFQQLLFVLIQAISGGLAYLLHLNLTEQNEPEKEDKAKLSNRIAAVLVCDLKARMLLDVRLNAAGFFFKKKADRGQAGLNRGEVIKAVSTSQGSAPGGQLYARLAHLKSTRGKWKRRWGNKMMGGGGWVLYMQVTSWHGGETNRAPMILRRVRGLLWFCSSDMGADRLWVDGGGGRMSPTTPTWHFQKRN